MKILMFGWEFPPHISGGLGTACEGLTWALSKEGVEIILVVPKLHGDEVAPFDMVSASDVPITPLAEIINGHAQLTRLKEAPTINHSALHQQIKFKSTDIGSNTAVSPVSSVNGCEITSIAPNEKTIQKVSVKRNPTPGSSISSDTGAAYRKEATANSSLDADIDNRADVNPENSGRTTVLTYHEAVGAIHKIQVSSPLLPYTTFEAPIDVYTIYRDEARQAATRLSASTRKPSVGGRPRVETFSRGLHDQDNQSALLVTDSPVDDDKNAMVLTDTTGEPDQNVKHQQHDGAMQTRLTNKAYRTPLKPMSFPVYKFSGRYGHDLLTEVRRLADVSVDIARTHDFDVIHAHDWMTFDAGLAASRLSGRPLVLHVHATEIDRSGSNPDCRIFEIEKKGLQACDHIIAVSQWTKQILVKYYHIPETKITAVHNGVMSPELGGGMKHANLLQAQIVSFVGRITYQKGPLYFVEAAFKVLEKFPNTHFVVAGSGDQLTRVIEQVSHLRMDSHFSFTGFLRGRDVDRLWSMTDVYVMPSVSEPFGLTPLEAIRAGVPVIVSKQSGVSEVMPHAMKVNFWDTDALANAICSILAYPTLARSMAQNAQRSLKSVTWERAARKVLSVYDLSCRAEPPADKS